MPWIAQSLDDELRRYRRLVVRLLAAFALTALPGIVAVQPYTQISAGENHTCALLDSGAVHCWGGNERGQLGNGASGSGTQSPEPVCVQNVSTAAHIAAGREHNCAALKDGAVRCWGYNFRGQLGNGLTAPSPTPVTVVGVSNAVEVRVSSFHACARLTDGSVRCWGRGTGGASGQDSYTHSILPVNLLGFGPGGPASQLALGAEHTCLLSQARQVFCTGRNDFGQISGTDISRARMSSVPISNVDDIAVGAYHSCARSGGTVSCWGDNSQGQLGDGTLGGTRNSPGLVLGISDAIAIAAGRHHTCALLAPGNVVSLSSVKCWGNNSTGQLGDDNSGGVSPTPVTVANLGGGGATARVIAAGYQHSCARLTDHTVQCWGGNSYGALGDGSYISSVQPKSVVGLLAAASGINVATEIAAGNETSCTLMSNGGLRCWGLNAQGKGGHGHSGIYQTTPQYVAAPGCALDFDGDGVTRATTDGVLPVRALRGMSGTAVGSGASGPGTRGTWPLVRTHLEEKCGVTGLAP